MRICDDRFLNDFLHQASGIFGITFLTEVEELLMQSPHCLLKMSFGCIPLVQIIRTTSTNICLGFCLEMFVLVSDVGTCVRIIAPKECTVDIYIVFIYFFVFFRSLEHWFVILASKMLYSLQTSAVQEVCKVSLQDHTIIERGLFAKFSQRHSNDYYSLDSWLKKNHTFQHL